MTLLTKVNVKNAYYTLGFTSLMRPFDWEPPIHWREHSEFQKLIYVIIIPRIEKLSTASMCRKDNSILGDDYTTLNWWKKNYMKRLL